MQLSSREIRTIKALAEILFPQEGSFSYGYKDIDIISFLEDFLYRVPLRVKWFLFFNLWVFEYFSWVSLLYCDCTGLKKNTIQTRRALSVVQISFFRNLIFWIKTPICFSKMSFIYREKIICIMRGNRYFVIRGIYLLPSIVLLIFFYSDERVMHKIGYCGYNEGENKLTDNK